MKIMSRPFRLLGVLALAVLGASTTGIILGSRAGHDTAPVHAGPPPTPRPVCFGYVEAAHGVASLYPAQPGRVEVLKVEENQEVKAGTVLLSLDKRQAHCLVRQAKAELDEARIRFDQAWKPVARQWFRDEQQRALVEAVHCRFKAACLLLARREEEHRATPLSDKEVEVARAQCDELTAVLHGEEKKLEELRLNDPREYLQRAEAALAVQQARYDQAVLGLNECDLKAPTDGTVLRILVNPGDVLGSQPKQPAILFCPKGPRVIRAEIEQEFARGLALGREASVQDDSSDLTTWKGRVVRVADWYTHRRSLAQEPLQPSDVRVLEFIIALDTPPGSLRLGQRLRVTVGPPASE